MEELKLLVESIANLPDLAIWVIAMYFFFKLAIVGSIFGVIRLSIVKAYDYFDYKTKVVRLSKEEETALANRQLEINKDKPIEHIHQLGSLSLSSSEDMTGKIVELFSNIKSKEDNWYSIHCSDIDKAINILKEAKNV